MGDIDIEHLTYEFMEKIETQKSKRKKFKFSINVHVNFEWSQLSIRESEFEVRPLFRNGIQKHIGKVILTLSSCSNSIV